MRRSQDLMSAARGVLGHAGIELVLALVRIVDLCFAALYCQLQAKIIGALRAGITSDTLGMVVCRPPCEAVPTLAEAAELAQMNSRETHAARLGRDRRSGQPAAMAPLHPQGPGPA